jgi:SAM-dependent methyltransferase
MMGKAASAIHDCPACGAATAHEFLYDKNRCRVWKCQGCGIGRTETREFDPAAYYTKDYFDGAHSDGYADYLGAERVLRREFADTVAFVRSKVKGGRLLDVGCAYGFFLQEAMPYFDVAGIEVAEDAVAHCRRNGLHVLNGVADADNLRQLGMMDVIVLLDVIEHVPHPYDTLALCAAHLNPGGMLMMTTGDFASTAARLAGRNWRLMTPPQHLWFFTPDSMKRLANRTGLRFETFDHPWKVVPLSLILFQLKRMVGMTPTKPTAASTVGVPVNLFDAMRVVMRKPEAA